eukprot:jgi/Chrzof1/4353/Cz14g10020.t1
MHWPVPYDTNDLNPPPVLTPPLHETWEAMEQLVDEGLVKTIGVSNFSIPKLHDIMVTHKARIKPAVNQIEVHPYLRNDKVIEHCRIHGIHVTAYGPLGTTGSVELWSPPPPGDVPGPMTDPVIKEKADKYGVTPAQLLVRWGLQHGTSVLPKSTKEERIKANYDVWKINLTPEDFFAIAMIPLQIRMCDGSWFLRPNGPYKTLEELWDEPDADGKKEQLYKALKKGCLKNTMKILPDRIIDVDKANEPVPLD